MKLHLLPQLPDAFVGRAEQLERLRHSLAAGRLLFIEGVYGIGKTTLALMLAQSIEKENPGLVYWVVCQDGWSADVLHREIKNWLPAEVRISYDRWYEKESHTINEKYLSLVNILNQLEITVFVDDLHLMECSYFIDILKILRTYLNRARFCFITREKPLLPFIDKADLSEEIVGGLTGQESMLLIDRLLNQRKGISKPAAHVLTAIVKKLEGHPLLIKTFSALLMEGLFAAGEFVHRRSECLDEIVEDLIVEMSRDLSGDEMTLLKLCSTSRIPLSQNIMTSPGLSDRMKRRFIITSDVDGKIFTSRLIRHHIQKQIDNDERQHLHEKLAEYFTACIDDSSDSNEHVREALYHYTKAGKTGEVESTLCTYADSMYSQGYYEDIILYTQSLPLSNTRLMTIRADVLSILGHPGEAVELLNRMKRYIPDERTLASVFYSLARASSRQGNFKEASDYCEKAYGLFRKFNDTKGIVDMLNTKAILSSYGLKMKDAAAFNHEALLIATKAEDAVGTARSLHVKSILLLEDGKYAESSDMAALCIGKAASLGAPLLAGRALIFKGMALSHLGCYDEAEKCLERGIEYARESIEIQLEALAFRGLSFLHGEQNALREALAEIETARDLFFICENRLAHDFSSLMKAKLLAELDRPGEAEMMLLKIVSSPACSDVPQLDVETRLSLAQIYLENTSEAAEAIRLAEYNIEVMSHLHSGERLGESYLIMAEVLWHIGERKKMESCLAHALLIAQQCESEYLTSCVLYLSGYAARKLRTMKQEYIEDAQSVMKKLKGSRKRLAARFFMRIDATVRKSYFIMMGEYCFYAMEPEVEQIRLQKRNFSLFIDLPCRKLYEKEKGQIDMLSRKVLTALLLFLVKNSGKSFSNREIFTAVWGYEYDSETSDNEVRKTVSRLRKLIEPENQKNRYVKLKQGYMRSKSEYYFTASESFCLIEGFSFR
ncbi:MAG: winged helix-turn-helix domain-containing protein [Candidatus Xenobiia bacterium LiM19]